MEFMERPRLVDAAKSLLYCLERGHDEDAQQWCLEILNGLYGDAVKSRVRLREKLEESLKWEDRHNRGVK